MATRNLAHPFYNHGKRLHEKRLTLGQASLFFAAIGATAVAAALVARAISADFVLPVVSTSLFVAAALLAAIGWPRRKAKPQSSVTYWDVAGALILIGIFAAALVDPGRLVDVTMGPRMP